MRVLHLSSSFPRSAQDHVAPFLLDLARAQQDAGVMVAVLAPHDPGTATQERLDGVDVHRFRYAPDRLERLAYRGGLLGQARTPAGLLLVPVFFVSFTLATLRLTRRLRPDVLHAHWWLPAGLCALLAARLTRTPLVVTLHGSDVHLLRHRPVRWVGATVLRRADAVAVVSEDLRRRLVEVLGVAEAKVLVLRMPVTAGGPATPLPPGPPVRLLAAGRLSPEKGFDVLLQALSIAVADGLDARLELVGSGPEWERLAGLAAPLGGRVAMLPAEPRAQLWRRMERAHALVVPSRREGLGLVALEALARGCRVLASRVGGLPEVVLDGEDGVLVAPDDVAALAGALVELAAADPAGPPRGRALEAHAPSEIAQAHVEVYTSASRTG